MMRKVEEEDVVVGDRFVRVVVYMTVMISDSGDMNRRLEVVECS